MAGSLSQPAGSTQFVQVQVLVIVDGVSYNPTGDTVLMAFITQTFPQKKPQSGDWHAAAWLTDPASFWAACLVGPENGGVVLAQDSYVVFVKVIDNPAVPVLEGPVLNIT